MNFFIILFIIFVSSGVIIGIILAIVNKYLSYKDNIRRSRFVEDILTTARNMYDNGISFKQVIDRLDQLPTDSTLSDMYYVTETHELYIWNGEWTVLELSTDDFSEELKSNIITNMSISYNDENCYNMPKQPELPEMPRLP